MINANIAFKSQIRKVNYADITLRDGTVLNLEPSDFILGGFSMTDETTTGKFGVGSTAGKTISITINNHTNKFSMYDFYKAIIYMYVSVTLEDGTVLKERKGKYYVINPTSPGDVIVLSGVDSMHLFDKPYNASTIYPASLQNILSDCCLDCGVNIGFRQFDNYNFVIDKKPEDCTYRQVVSWVSQIAGYNARISNADYLEFVWYDTSLIENILDGGKLFSYDETDTYDGGDFTTYTDTILWDGGNFTDPYPENVTKIKSISVSTDDVVITGVMVKYDDTEVLSGEEGYCITISDNDLVIGKEAEIAQYLGNRLIGLRFRPLSCQIANNPLIEPFDIVYVYDRKGNAYFTFINSVNYSISGFTTIACKAEDPIRNESHYISKDAQAVVKVRKEAKEELSSYDKAVQNMNSLAANAMGLYRETEELTSGIIYYMSNKPIYKKENGKCEFIANAFVYKMTGDGFFVSTDGGLTYTSGLDAEGNAVVNVLSAIGITFDWAKGGTLTLGGYDNANGVLHVLDENGKVVGKWDNTGITFPPGTTISWNQITDKDKVANKEDIPTDNKELTNGAQYTTKIDVNSIITNKVTASFVNALNVKAGSVDAENITGTKINGKAIEGGSINIGTKFEVNSSGEVTANSLKSNNATITGGNINIKTDKETYSAIKLSYDEYSIEMSPLYLTASNNNYFTKIGSVEITLSDYSYNKQTNIYPGWMRIQDNYSSVEIYPNKISVSNGNLEINNGTLIIGGTSKFNCSGNSTFSGSIISDGYVTLNKGLKITYGYGLSLTVECDTVLKGNCKIGDSTYDTIGFFGDSGSSKKTVNTITSISSATSSSNASKINEIINALKEYNLM